MIIYKVEIDKEVREGWTLRDFIYEIDETIHMTMFGHSILRVPRTYQELRHLIDSLIPRHIFTNIKQEQQVVDDLTKYYANQYGYEE